MRAIGQADRAARPADFLHRDDMVEIAQAQPAPFLFHGDAVQAQRAHRLPQLAREAVFAVDRGGQRQNLFVGKATRPPRGSSRAFGQAEIEIGGGAHRGHTGLPAATGSHRKIWPAK
jgi:hypothetical protein